MSRRGFFALALGLIAAGLLLRLPRWGLPLAIHHYGGGVLWGAMIFALAAALRPPGRGVGSAVVAALAIVAVVEAFRLYHAPSLDAFRATLAGQLLLGRLFSPWNILADGAGVLIAAAATWRAHPREPAKFGRGR